MATKIKTDAIQNLNVSWENYCGQSIEDFIKSQLKASVGYLYRTPTKIGDYYYIYCFQSIADFQSWQVRENDALVLQKIQLPNIENDQFAVRLETNSNTTKLVNLGDGIKINLRYTSISQNPTTEAITDTYNDGYLVILRSANGSAYTEVGRETISPVEYNDTETYTTVDITKYLADGTNKIRLRVEDSVNGTVSNNINFQEIINTSLIVSNAMDLSKPLNQPVMQFYIQGQVQKTLNVKISGENVAATTYTASLGTTTYIEVPYDFAITDSFQTGILNVEAWLSVDDTTLQSQHINLQVYYIDSVDDNSIIILNNVTTNCTNYTTTKFFDFTIYNKRSDVEITIGNGLTTFLKYTFSDCEVNKTYSYSNVLEVSSASKQISANITVKTSDMTVVQPITIDNSVDFNPVKNASFQLNPKTRDNSDAEPETIINAAANTSVTAEFHNFKKVSDLWVSDDDNIKILRVPAGAWLSFDYDPLDDISKGVTIELDFKTYNIFNDEDIIFKFCNYNDSNNPIGFEMKSLQAVYMTNDNQTRRDQDVFFAEGQRTHMAINIIPNVSNLGINYVRIFLNGTINREFTYTDSDLFKYNAQDVKFVIGNPDAQTDIDIYNIRVYKKSLSASDVRQNYMSSLPTNAAKIEYKTKNDILSAADTISYDKAVVKYNTLVWTGKHPEYSTGKVKYTGDLQINIIDDKKHSGTITNLKISGQGSSSRNYWKWNHQYDWTSSTVYTNGNGEVIEEGYQLTDDDPFCKTNVSKLNWASSMQSHKMGSCKLYNDLWKEVIGGNGITKTRGYENYRTAINEKPFLYFFKETATSQPVFGGLVTFGSAKGGGEAYCPMQDENTPIDEFSNWLLLEGSDNGMPLTLRQVPWIDDEVTYNEDEEYFEYAGSGNLDYDGGKLNNYTYFANAYNFSYQHSLALVPFDGNLTALNAANNLDTGKQYWNKSNGDVYRFDWNSETWVDAGMTRTTDYEYHFTTQTDVDNGDAEEVGIKIVDQYPVYSKFNLVTQTGVQLSGNSTTDNNAFIAWRKRDFKDNIKNYYNVNDTLFNMAFIKLIAGSDNWCKNTYEYLDPKTLKICWLNDDLDTIFLTDNVGRKTKPYYVEEHDMNGDQAYFNGSDNVFFNLMETCFVTEYRDIMKSIFAAMGSTEFGGSIANCMDRYYFSTQKYFPSVAYNVTARLLYEEASVAQKAGTYKNGTPAISQSLGDQYLAELGWWQKRQVYLTSWARSNPFAVRSTGSLFFRSMLKTDSNRPSYSFSLTPYQYLYPKVGIGQTLGSDNQRVVAGNAYNTISLTTDGNTDTFIYGADYYTNFGEFGGHSIGEAFNLTGARLTEFSADSRKVGSYQFRPTSMTVSCPNLRKLTLYGASTLKSILDLSSEVKLQQVDLRGTGFSSVVLPQTETLTTAYLPDLTSVNIVNVPNLNSFFVEGTSNLTSLTTDNDIILDKYINSGDISAMTEIHLQNVNLDLTSASSTISNNMYTLLTKADSTATGRIKLNKQLTLSEQQALINKYGNIDSENNGLYVEYILQTQNDLQIVGDNAITQTKSKTYSVSYSGNDIRGYVWNVTNGEMTVINDYTISVKATAEDADDDIIISCTVHRLRNTDIVDIKTVDIIEYKCVSSISFDNFNAYRPGTYEIPISHTPSNMSVDIQDVIPTITGVGANCTVKSCTFEKVVIETTEPTQDITGTLKVYVEDVDGNHAECTKTINIWKTVALSISATGENSVNYGNVVEGDNDETSKIVLQMDSDICTFDYSLPEGYELGDITSSSDDVEIISVENNKITLKINFV